VAVIERIKPQVSPAIEVDRVDEEYQSKQLKAGILKTLRWLVRESRSTMLIDTKVKSNSVDAKDLFVIVIYPLDKSLLDIFCKLTGSFLTMALGIYDKRIPAPWDAQPKLSSTIIKPGG